jgi:hypothetical protein
MTHPTGPLTRSRRTGTGSRTAVPNIESNPMTEPSVRSNAMLLMHEELARARMSDYRDEAENYRRCARLLAARRWQRKAAQASRRARQAQNAVW